MKQEHQKSREAGLFLPSRELSLAIGVILFLSLAAFCLGYFLGQRRAVSLFLGKVKEESFADNITYSFYALDQREPAEEDQDENGSAEEASEAEQPAGTLSEGASDEITHEANQKEVPEKDLEESSYKITYVAPLVGFGTLHAANAFAERVRKKGIPIIVKERSSKTPKGRIISWYQAITQEYSDKSELEVIIARVQQQEKIKDVKIIEKKKG